MAGKIDAPTVRMLTGIAECKGISILTGVQIAEISGTERVTGVKLAGGF
jgi:NAD(P)H-nitrite reductase large subunit